MCEWLTTDSWNLRKNLGLVSLHTAGSGRELNSSAKPHQDLGIILACWLLPITQIEVTITEFPPLIAGLTIIIVTLAHSAN